MLKKLPSSVSALAVAAGLCSVIPGVAVAGPSTAANQTIFGPNVYVFDPSMTDVQSTANSIFSEMESNQFGTQRYALLFKKGTYNVNFSVGFYTHVAGLGQNPDDVLINGGANVTANWMADANATCNFWRTYENFAINPSATNGTTTIAVSQAAPIRRMHIKGGLWLFQVASNGSGGWASGGFLADSVVDGQVLPGSQQQWLSRNSKWGSWANGVWNMVFVGDVNAPAASFPDPPYTVVSQTPVIREKPYLYINSSGQYAVFVPNLQTNTSGPTWTSSATPGTSIGIDQFYIAQPSTASAASINSALASGKHILFTPGIYSLNDTLKVTKANTIILGLGDPSLIPTSGLPAISVSDVDGVKIAGLILDAGSTNSASLLEVGPTGSTADHSSNPTFLYDLTVRTGGASAGKNDAGIKINSNNVVGDQLWLWRADHGAGAGWSTNPTKNGLVVNGNNVTIYGLFNEHHEQYQTLWNGNGGRVYFYQSEMPYDVPNQSSWMSGSTNGYASYKVASNVTSHEAWGVGIYSYFRDAAVKANSAIEAPAVSGVKFHNSTTIWLNGQTGSEITHIINNTGGRVYASSPTDAMRQTLAEFSGSGSGSGGGSTGAALSRTNWTASSNPTSGDVPANLIDNNLSSRWSTGTPMVNGQYFIVDMQSAQTFNKLTMDSTNASGDYARGYQVFVSNDGSNFGSAIASGTGSAAVITASFATQSARYIKVVQTGSSSSWWSINEFNVYY